ncbi:MULTISPECIES: protein NO VEIN domain-containing protein [unclassified Blastococcus]
MFLTDTPIVEHSADPTAVQDAAIAFVLAQEAAAGRAARDVRGSRTPGDVVSGDRTVEVRAVPGSVRGEDVWLESRLYDMARAHPDRFWFYVVENTGQGDPAAFRLLRLGGEPLQRMLEQATKRRYYAVPVPAGFGEEPVVAS